MVHPVLRIPPSVPAATADNSEISSEAWISHLRPDRRPRRRPGVSVLRTRAGDAEACIPPTRWSRYLRVTIMRGKAQVVYRVDKHKTLAQESLVTTVRGRALVTVATRVGAGGGPAAHSHRVRRVRSFAALAREVGAAVERDGRGLRLTASGQAYSVMPGHPRPARGGARAARGDRDRKRGRVRVRGQPPRGITAARRAAGVLAHHPTVDLASRWAAASGGGACSPRTSPTW